MISATILLAAQKSADRFRPGFGCSPLSPRRASQPSWSNLVKGFWVQCADRGAPFTGPAIRNGAETLKLLVPGSAAYQAVENHVLAEARLSLFRRAVVWNWIAS